MSPRSLRMRNLCAIAVVGLSFSAVATASTLNVHANADIRSTDPGVNRDSNTDGVVLHMVEGLVGYNAKGEPKPLLAETIDVSDDGLTYTFNLRKDVKFHNGEPFTAQDVVWSWNRYMDPQTGWRCLSDFDGRVRLKVESVDATDAHTVVFQISQADPLFLSSLARNDCGMTAITHKDSLKSDGSWDKPIGTGPFKLNEWRQREYISLARYDDYVSLPGEPDGYVGGKMPLVDEIRFVVIPDAATARTAFQRGDIDILQRLPYAEAAEFRSNPKITVYPSSIWAPNTLLFQTQDPLLGKLAMRQAIAAALDVEQLVAGVTYDIAEANQSIVPLSSPFHSEVQKEGFIHDNAKVKKLLAEAGYKGERLLITTNKQYTHHFDMALVAQAMLQQAGINAELEVVEWGTQQDKWQKGNYQLMAFGYSARMDPALNYESIMGPKATQPRKVWEDAESLNLLTQVMRESDTKARQKMFDQLHRNAIAQIPLIVLFNTVNNDVAHNSVEGFRTSVFGTPRLWRVSKSDTVKKQ